MPICDQCTCQYPADLVSDLCPNCGERIRRCPWCGETIPWSFAGRSSPCCDKPLKYVRTHGPDVPLLIRGEGLEGGPIFLRVVRAVAFRGGKSTVYQVAPVKQLGDPFLLEGQSPPPVLCLKEIVNDTRDPISIFPPVIIERLKRLRHPNVVPFYGAWSDGDRFFLLLDWIPGQTAAERYLTGGKGAPISALKRIGEEILEGMMAMSRKEVGLLHCDITPTNVMFDADERPVLIDMGSIQAMEAPDLPPEFTPNYAPLEFYPPNQRPPEYEHRPDLIPGTASDRYMLGATLFALACGQDAKEEHTETGLPIVVPAPERAKGTAQARMGAMRPDLPRSFTFWVDGLLGLLPEDRFASHEAAKKALKGGMRGLESAQRSGSSRSSGKGKRVFPRSKAWGSSRYRISLLSALTTVLLAFVILMMARYPSVSLRPWVWPRMVSADLALHTGQPAKTLSILNGAAPRDWDAQIMLAQAQLANGAPYNALKRLQGAAAQQSAPARVDRALRSVARGVAVQDLYNGLRLMERGERYPAYLRLKQAAKLGVTSAQGDWALAQLSLERGDKAGAKHHLARYLQARPNSIRGRLFGAQLALALDDPRGAYAHALRAKQLAASSPSASVEPVDASRMETALSQVAASLLAAVPGDPSGTSSRGALQGQIERITMARSLTPSADLDRRLARTYERLGDLDLSEDAGLSYGRACEVLKKSLAQYGNDPTTAALLARCQAKLDKRRY